MGRGRGFRGLVVALVALGLLAFAPGAGAAFPDDVFDGEATGGGAIDCEEQPDRDRFCGGPDTTVDSFDGVTIDVNVTFPPAPDSGPDGDFPLIGLFHGWGGQESPKDSDEVERFVDLGYAVFTMSDRGWDHSCGKDQPSFLNDPSCQTTGYNRLMDTRYEVRDAQDFFAVLVDEGAVDADRLGSAGGSYGGGLSMALAALNDRQMMRDGSLVAWKSPEKGTPLSLAAAIPEIPWTDLAYSLVPNGGTLDYTEDSDYFKRGQFGVMKESFVSGLYAVGVATSNFDTIPPIDPDAAVNEWYTLLTVGEPYDGDPEAEDIAEEVTSHHSSYYIDDSVEPAPLFISNGFTDDLFPPDEAIRFYNRTRANHPDPDISLMFLDYGHQRGQNKDADIDALRAKEDAWLAHYLRGDGSKPPNEVETLTQTCPGSAASGGPFTAPTWRELSPGEIVLRGNETQLISPGAANPGGRAYDPIAGGGACATASGADQAGVANYRLEVPAGGFTLMGSPTIVGDVFSPAPNNQLTYRLLDVDPDGDATLVARGIYRPDDNATTGTRQVFQAHPNGYEFVEGHEAKLELRPSDEPYARPSNGQGPMTVANLELRLPVVEEPGGELVTEPAPKVVPEGYELAPGYGAAAEADSDGDGIANGEDACPSEPGPASNDGCPDGSEATDSDGDGVPDQNDGCPNEAGPSENVGCPSEDDSGEGSDGNPPGDGNQAPDPFAPARCQTTLLSADSTTAGSDEGETIVGTEGDDVLNGNGGRDTVVGLAGNDCLTGDDGFDTIRGKSGDDVAFGGKGRDFMKGNQGDDHFEGGGGKDRIRLAGGNDTGKGKGGNDNVSTGNGNDKIGGGPGDDRLFGNEGNDKIRGGGGDDVLFGGGGPRNVLNGGKGKDRCIIASRAKNKTRNCEKVLVGGARG